MGNFISVPVLFIAAVIQATFVPQIRLLGGGPDLVFLLVLLWSINARLEESILWAFAGGIFLDMLSGAPVGTSTLGMLLVIFGVSGIGQQVYGAGLILVLVSVVLGTIVRQAVLYFVLTLDDFTVLWTVVIGYVLLPTLIYNLAMALPVYWFVRRIQGWASGPDNFAL